MQCLNNNKIHHSTIFFFIFNSIIMVSSRVTIILSFTELWRYPISSSCYFLSSANTLLLVLTWNISCSRFKSYIVMTAKNLKTTRWLIDNLDSSRLLNTIQTNIHLPAINSSSWIILIICTFDKFYNAFNWSTLLASTQHKS